MRCSSHSWKYWLSSEGGLMIPKEFDRIDTDRKDTHCVDSRKCLACGEVETFSHIDHGGRKDRSTWVEVWIPPATPRTPPWEDHVQR